METAFYPVITVDTYEELEAATAYCDINRIEFQFLNENQEMLPAQIILFIDEEDFNLFLDSIG